MSRPPLRGHSGVDGWIVLVYLMAVATVAVQLGVCAVLVYIIHTWQSLVLVSVLLFM